MTREQTIQAHISKSLTKSGWMVVKLIKTTCNGIPDLLCLKAGKTVFIEVKRGNNKPTYLQLYRMEQLKEQGFEVLTANKIEDVEHLLTKEKKHINFFDALDNRA